MTSAPRTSAADAPANPAFGHHPALDGVRALAIVLVMGLHADRRIFPRGDVGVDIFFTLSAFLITALMIEELQQRNGAYSFRGFYERRARRLGPALVLWLVFVAAPSAALAGQSDLIVESTVASLLYVGNYAMTGLLPLDIASAYAHIWSLAIEEQFYLIWPALFVVLSRRAMAYRRLALVLLAALAFVVQWLSGRYFLPTGHAVPILLGCVAAEFHMARRPAHWQRLTESGIAGFLCLVICIGVASPASQVIDARLVAIIGSIAATLLLLHAVSERDTSVNRLLGLRPATWTGRRSYGLYLYHRTLAETVPALLPSLTLRTLGPLTLGVSFVLAAASFRYVELPVILRGQRRRAHDLAAREQASEAAAAEERPG